MASENKMRLKLLFRVKIFLGLFKIATNYPKGVVHYLVAYVLTDLVSDAHQGNFTLPLQKGFN